MKSPQISLFLLPLLFSPITHALIISDGATGYVGDLPPMQSNMSLYMRGSVYGGSAGVSNIDGFCHKNKEQWKSYLFPFPGSKEGEYGLKLYNRNVSASENKQNYLVAAINGTMVITHTHADYGMRRDTTIRLIRGKEVSKQGEYSDGFTESVPMCWYGQQERMDNIRLIIASYSVYAIGYVKPGIYDFVQPVYLTGAQNDGSSPVVMNKTPFSFGTGPIHVLKTCEVTPASSTSIQYPSQLAGKFNSPKLLDKQIANIAVSCANSGNLYVSLKPFGELVNSSKTGMKMTPAIPLKNTESAPYITVSKSEKAATDSVCRNNDSTALPFYDGQPVGAYQSGSIMKLLSFNLCANGTIPANNYKGSIDASFLIE